VRCGDVLVRIENRTLGEKGNADGFAIKLEENDEVGWDLRLRWRERFYRGLRKEKFSMLFKLR